MSRLIELSLKASNEMENRRLQTFVYCIPHSRSFRTSDGSPRSLEIERVSHVDCIMWLTPLNGIALMKCNVLTKTTNSCKTANGHRYLSGLSNIAQRANGHQS